MLQVCRIIVGRKHPKTTVFLRMTDKHANLCLFPCLNSFPLGFAWYYNLSHGVDTKKSCFSHIQTIVHYFFKETVNNFSCFLLFLFMSLFFPHSDNNCCPFPWFSLSLPIPFYCLSAPAWCGWKRGWDVGGCSYGVKNIINKARKREINGSKVSPKGNCIYCVYVCA